MKTATPFRCLKRAQASLEEARSLLVTPTLQALSTCCLCLQEVAHELELFPDALNRTDTSGTGELLAKAERIRSGAAQLRPMLLQAAAFHRGWVQMWALMTAGYNAQGGPEELKPVHQVSVEG